MRPFALLVPLLALTACKGGDATPLGVTLEDGHLLIGTVSTRELRLEGLFGEIAIPIDHVGMVVPVEGRTLKHSNNHVTVWLRNGSELNGRWTEPELAIGLSMGGGTVTVQVPADRMQALQLQGQEQWPSDGLYRVRTSWGDDLLVDPAKTRIRIANDLGTFAPFLSECRSIGPVGDPTGDWRIVLETGTVLIGPLQEESITFGLPMGPGQLTVPLADLTGMTRGAWRADPIAASPAEQMADPREMAAPMVAPQRSPRRAASPGLSQSDGWFDGDQMQSAKRR